MRRCLQLEKRALTAPELAELVNDHFPHPAARSTQDSAAEPAIADEADANGRAGMIREFLKSGGADGRIAPDQLLNAIALLEHPLREHRVDVQDSAYAKLRKTLLRPLTPAQQG
jgi:hypothetical protein